MRIKYKTELRTEYKTSCTRYPTVMVGSKECEECQWYRGEARRLTQYEVEGIECNYHEESKAKLSDISKEDKALVLVRANEDEIGKGCSGCVIDQDRSQLCRYCAPSRVFKIIDLPVENVEKGGVFSS